MKKQLTMCGYRCDLCKAYAPNIKRHDQRDTLSALWKKYYDIDIAAEHIYCDGCRCMNPKAKRIDNNCPVRRCVMDKGIEHCGLCEDYPCEIFELRRGLSSREAQEKLSQEYDEDEYNEYLLCYDNKSRLDKMKE